MLIVFFRAIILYVVIIFSIRLMGKRQLGELQPSELVITILVSNIATLPIEDVNIPMLMGIIPILTLVSLDVIMSSMSLKFRKIRKMVSGTPKVVVNNGVIDQKMLKSLRFSIDDLMESLRGYGIFDVNEVQYAIVETTGSISVYQKFSNQPCTAEMMNLKKKTKNPPQLIIDDGVLVENALSFVNLGQGWLYGILTDNGVSIKDVFILTADETGAFNIIKKDGVA